MGWFIGKPSWRCFALFVLVPWTCPGQSVLPLHAQGRQIRDSSDAVVQLRGVNVGGWLVTESWMCGQTDDGGRLALEQLENRFGPKRAAALMNAWQDNWFTTADLDLIQKYGCNLLRVPFSYRTLQNADGTWKRDGEGNIDYSRMDWVVREAQRRDLYVIFDLHIWPGEYHVISRITPAGDAARAQMAALWKQVAHHYRGSSTIAGFDVINEPEGSPGNALQWAFYNAIRQEDPQRMLIFESVDYGSIAGTGWSNIVWSAHYPENVLKTGGMRDRMKKFDRQHKISARADVQVPIFIGETKAPQDTADSAAELANAYNDLGWSWCVWTYKGVDVGGWASMNYDRSLKYDLASDSFDSILQKWTWGLSNWQNSSRETSLHANHWWIEGFGRGFKDAGRK